MKDKQSVSLDALNGLLSERQRYEEWLSALEGRKSNTSEAVYQKVRADYEVRLKEVSNRLASRAGELRDTIDSLTAKLQDISRDEVAQHESRQEAELRAAVGEHTGEEWQKLKQESEKELARVARDRTSVETQLAELNRVFALSNDPAAAGTRPSVAPGAAASSAVSSAPKPATPSTQKPGTPSTQKLATSPTQSGVKRSMTSGWPQRDGDDSASEISVSPDSRGTPAASRPSPAGPPFEEFATLSQPPEGGASKQPAETTKRSGLPDLRTEQQKTLKCPECGAANYPTEWYCERCGGELATL